MSKIVYMANDGQTFKTKTECDKHELWITQQNKFLEIAKLKMQYHNTLAYINRSKSPPDIWTLQHLNSQNCAYSKVYIRNQYKLSVLEKICEILRIKYLECLKASGNIASFSRVKELHEILSLYLFALKIKKEKIDDLIANRKLLRTTINKLADLGMIISKI